MLRTVLVAFPARPNQVPVCLVFEDRRVDGPFIRWICDLALHLPLARKRVGIRVFYYEHSMALVRSLVGRKIDVSFASNEMNLRSPDFMGVRSLGRRSPDNFFGRGPEIGHVCSLPKRQVRARRIHVVIETVLVFHPGIRARREQRISESLTALGSVLPSRARTRKQCESEQPTHLHLHINSRQRFATPFELAMYDSFPRL